MIEQITFQLSCLQQQDYNQGSFLMMIKHIRSINAFYQAPLVSRYSTLDLGKIKSAKNIHEMLNNIQTVNKDDPSFGYFLKKFTLMLKKEDCKDDHTKKQIQKLIHGMRRLSSPEIKTNSFDVFLNLFLLKKIATIFPNFKSEGFENRLLFMIESLPSSLIPSSKSMLRLALSLHMSSFISQTNLAFKKSFLVFSIKRHLFILREKQEDPGHKFEKEDLYACVITLGSVPSGSIIMNINHSFFANSMQYIKVHWSSCKALLMNSQVNLQNPQSLRNLIMNLEIYTTYLIRDFKSLTKMSSPAYDVIKDLSEYFIQLLKENKLTLAMQSHILQALVKSCFEINKEEKQPLLFLIWEKSKNHPIVQSKDKLSKLKILKMIPYKLVEKGEILEILTEAVQAKMTWQERCTLIQIYRRKSDFLSNSQWENIFHSVLSFDHQYNFWEIYFLLQQINTLSHLVPLNEIQSELEKKVKNISQVKGQFQLEKNLLKFYALLMLSDNHQKRTQRILNEQFLEKILASWIKIDHILPSNSFDKQGNFEIKIENELSNSEGTIRNLKKTLFEQTNCYNQKKMLTKIVQHDNFRDEKFLNPKSKKLSLEFSIFFFIYAKKYNLIPLDNNFFSQLFQKVGEGIVLKACMDFPYSELNSVEDIRTVIQIYKSNYKAVNMKEFIFQWDNYQREIEQSSRGLSLPKDTRFKVKALYASNFLSDIRETYNFAQTNSYSVAYIVKYLVEGVRCGQDYLNGDFHKIKKVLLNITLHVNREIDFLAGDLDELGILDKQFCSQLLQKLKFKPGDYGFLLLMFYIEDKSSSKFFKNRKQALNRVKINSNNYYWLKLGIKYTPENQLQYEENIKSISNQKDREKLMQELKKVNNKVKEGQANAILGEQLFATVDLEHLKEKLKTFRQK